MHSCAKTKHAPCPPARLPLSESAGLPAEPASDPTPLCAYHAAPTHPWENAGRDSEGSEELNLPRRMEQPFAAASPLSHPGWLQVLSGTSEGDGGCFAYNQKALPRPCGDGEKCVTYNSSAWCEKCEYGTISAFVPNVGHTCIFCPALQAPAAVRLKQHFL